jgi:hypothetical protein
MFLGTSVDARAGASVVVSKGTSVGASTGALAGASMGEIMACCACVAWALASLDALEARLM